MNKVVTGCKSRKLTARKEMFKYSINMIKKLLIITSLLIVASCSLSIETFSNNLNSAVKGNDDPETIKQALPAYLVLIDSMIESDPEDEEALKASADLLNAYSGLININLELLDEDDGLYEYEKLKSQKSRVINKSLNRISKSICLYNDQYCDLRKINYQELTELVKEADEEDISYLYSFSQSWVAWVQDNSEDWNATAQLPNIKLILETIIEMDETYERGSPHMYLGILNSLIPETLGGKPEKGKAYFESAIELSQNGNKMAKVLFAEYYARLVFNEELHNRLLKEVIEQENSIKEFTLINQLAEIKAKKLVDSGKEYFE